jgi:hypothetical protein
VHSTESFDAYRAQHGEARYQPHEWDPRDADPLLQRARAMFPGLRPWTGPAEGKRAPASEQLATSLQWPQRD